MLPVGDGRGRSRVAVGIQHGALGRPPQFHRPQDFPGGGVETVPEDPAAELGVTGLVDIEGGQKNPAAGDRDPALPAIGEHGPPPDVLIPGHAPLHRGRRAVRLPVAVGTRRLRPVGPGEYGNEK